MGVGVFGVGLWFRLLRVVDVVGWVVWVERFLSRMRWDLRVVTAVMWLWVVIGGQGRVLSVRLSSWMICGTLWSSSPVRVYRR